MPRPVYRKRWAWVVGTHTSPQETIPDVESAGFALSSLADQGLLTTRQLADFQDETGLADLTWQCFWNRTALADAGDDLRSLFRRTQGFVIFMHGWSSTGGVWGHLPALTCAASPRLIALVPDLNGFGGSPYLAETPAVEQCDPRAVMQVVTHWVDILGLRSSARAQKRRRVITFVGHSMGGAALFYLQERGWHANEFARCAIAPTLLHDANLRRGFYQALGIDLWMNKPVNGLRSQLTRQVVERLVGVASETMRAEHLRTFEAAPIGTLAQTFYAMGAASGELTFRHWPNFRVILAHSDQLLNVSRMLQLLDTLGFGAQQVQVVRGEHFLFSASDGDREIQLRNRELVLGEILYLHEVCREQQRA